LVHDKLKRISDENLGGRGVTKHLSCQWIPS